MNPNYNDIVMANIRGLAGIIARPISDKKNTLDDIVRGTQTVTRERRIRLLESLESWLSYKPFQIEVEL